MGNIISQFFSVLMKPGAVLKNLKDEGENTGIVPSIIFVLVLTFVSGLLAAMLGMFNPPAVLVNTPLGKGGMWLWYLVLGPIVILLGSFTSAFFLWGITDGFFKGSLPQYKTTYKILALTAAFYPVSAILTSIISFILPHVSGFLWWVVQFPGWLLQGWVMIFVLWGIVSVKGAKLLQTVVILVITIVLLALAAVLGPRLAQLGGTATNFPAMGTEEMAPTDNAGTDQTGTDQIDKMMQEEAQKETQKK